MNYPYYFFGSANSIDIDVLVDHPDATGEEKDKEIIKTLKIKYPDCKNWNINVIQINDNVVTKSIPSKGSIDSVHNSLFYTYELHDQFYRPSPLHKPVKRNLPLAVIRCIRFVLTIAKGTLQEPFYKSVNRRDFKSGNWKARLELLLKQDYDNAFYEDSIENIDVYKRIAFFIGQTISLLQGIEIYTKDDLIKHHPSLSNFINRIDTKIKDSLKAKVHELYDTVEKLDFEQSEPFIVKFENSKFDFKHERLAV